MFTKNRTIIMRSKLILIVTAGLVMTKCTLHRQDNINASLTHLLNQKEFFKLETQLNENKNNLEPDKKLYFQAFVDNVFNRNQASVNSVDTLLNTYSSKFTDSAKAALLQIQEDSYFKLFQYVKAADADSILLSHYANALDSEQVSDIKNTFSIRNALRSIPPQETIIKGNTSIRWIKNTIGLVEIPVKQDAATYNAIFDTRANISSITETYAAKLGLKILPVVYEKSSGITGIKFKSRLGIADSLLIGNILIRNAVFQVMPDSILYLAPLKLTLNIIIGFPVIAQLKEVHILKDGWMIIPQLQTSSNLHNFALDGPDPVISLLSGKDTLSCNFDLGAGNTDLYYAFFEKYKSKIVKEGHTKTIHLGGAGGILEKKVYVLPSLELSLGNKKVILDSVDIFTEKISPGEKMYGNIGNDFASQFNELIINFDQMYIKGN